MDSRITNIGVALPWGSHDCCRCPKMLRTWQSLVPCWLHQKQLMHDCRRMGLCVTASYLMWLPEASKYRRCPYFAGLLRGFFSGSRIGYIGSSSLIPLTAQSDMDAGVCDLRTHRWCAAGINPQILSGHVCQDILAHLERHLIQMRV